VSTIKTGIGFKDQATNTRFAPVTGIAETDVQRAIEAVNASIAAYFPSPSIDNGVPRFDGIVGHLQNSGLTIDDTDFLSGAAGVGIGGAVADAANRLSVNTPAALFNRETDNIQVKLNKQSAGDTASFLYQTAFSGRAEIGLVGGDDFQFKTSPDGAVFTAGISIAATDAVVSIPVRIQPSANDGAALGASGTAWSDVFLASGGTIDFNAGDVTLTHSANALAFAGASSGYSFDASLLLGSGTALNWNAGDVTVTHAANALAFAGASSGYTFDATVSPATNDAAALGTTALGWADLFFATGGTIHFANTDWVATHTTGILTVGTGDLRVTTAGTNAASVVTVGGTQTLTSKTLTSPAINTGTVGTSLTPTSNDGAALGTGALSFSDLFLASGAVLNFNNGNYTVTHSAGLLTTNGALSIGTGNAFTCGTIELGAASDTTLSRTAAGAVAIEGAAVKTAGKETVWVSASAMRPRSVNGPGGPNVVNLATNNITISTLDFDATNFECAVFEIAMPKSWNEGTFTCQFVWSHAATTTNFGVVWGLEALATSDDDAMDAALGTLVQTTDTGGTTNDRYISPESTAVTAAGSPAEGDVVYFQVSRRPADASDTMAIDARLHGIRLFFTTNAANDT
jgi:hypothetical protein